jgi:hypothetical protein
MLAYSHISYMQVQNTQNSLLEQINDKLLRIDPIYFIEKYLKLDGKPFRINKNGYKAFSDIYRTIGIRALERNNSLPIIIVKARQVGASTMAAALEMFFMGSGLFGSGEHSPIRIIHTFPTLSLAYDYSKVKLTAMINDSVIMGDEEKLPRGQKPKSYMQSLLDNSPSSDSLQFKQFDGGNHIFIESVGIEGGRMRGKTSDVVFFDEVQLMSGTAIGNSLKVLAKSQYGAIGSGVQVFFGTPLQRGSEFWQMWNQSSQQYYHLGCEKCKKLFPLYSPNSNEWENTWLYGFVVRCAHCGFEQDKRDAAERGKWVPLKDPSECRYIGFHLNQLYMPDFTKEKIISEKPGVSAINTEKTYQNEVLGEFYQGEAITITPEQIRELCGDPERKFRAEIPSTEDTLVFLGIDWGMKGDLEQLVDSDKVKQQGQSYSTAVIISMTGPHRMSIEFATKFKRNDVATKKGLVEEMMRKYNVKLAVGDLGFSYDLSQILQNEHGDKYLTSQASARVNEKVKFNDQIFPKCIVFERDWWIAELYEQMRKGHVRFPMGDYEKIFWLIQHCTSMEIKPSISRTGDITPHYVKSGSPNDGMMALLNAYIAYKFYISDGLRIKNPLLMKEIGKVEKPMVIAAYLPRLFKGKK